MTDAAGSGANPRSVLLQHVWLESMPAGTLIVNQSQVPLNELTEINRIRTYTVSVSNSGVCPPRVLAEVFCSLILLFSSVVGGWVWCRRLQAYVETEVTTKLHALRFPVRQGIDRALIEPVPCSSLSSLADDMSASKPNARRADNSAARTPSVPLSSCPLWNRAEVPHQALRRGRMA